MYFCLPTLAHPLPPELLRKFPLLCTARNTALNNALGFRLRGRLAAIETLLCASLCEALASALDIAEHRERDALLQLKDGTAVFATPAGRIVL
jgi:hypothetical protein